MKLHAHYYLVGLRWKARKEAKASAVVLKLQKLQGSDIRRAGKGKGPEAGRKRACGFADALPHPNHLISLFRQRINLGCCGTLW